MTYNHSYREGRTDAPVLMLSVAGRDEEKMQRPAAGAARRHLDALLCRLHATRPELAPYPDADSYPILNAHPGIEYRRRTGRTEAPLAEYVEPSNLARVLEHVGGRPVIAFGERAKRTCRAAGIIPTLVGRHPSSLNRIRNSEVGGSTPEARSTKRYDLAAKLMLASEPRGSAA